MGVDVKMLTQSDAAVLERVAPDVLDRGVEPGLIREFLADSRHHLAVAVDEGVVVGITSAVDYIHPDKPRELWINEVGVAASHRRQGVATRLLGAVLDHGRSLGCRE